jgi:hypothetical protein
MHETKHYIAARIPYLKLGSLPKLVKTFRHWFLCHKTLSKCASFKVSISLQISDVQVVSKFIAFYYIVRDHRR